jgi:hypothetical protein
VYGFRKCGFKFLGFFFPINLICSQEINNNVLFWVNMVNYFIIMTISSSGILKLMNSFPSEEVFVLSIEIIVMEKSVSTT